MKSFDTPDELRKYILATSALMRCGGYEQESNILEGRERLSCTSGWEWLGEITLGVEGILNAGNLPNEISSKLETILATAKSKKPYGK